MSIKQERKGIVKRKIQKRILALLLMCVLVIACIPATVAQAAVVAQGSCGDNVTWSLEGGVLTLSGTGDMKNYSSEKQIPWADHRQQILEVTVAEGVTSVSAAAFYGCENLLRVVLADSVTTIGLAAFMDCKALRFLKLPAQLAYIGESAFSQCESLNAIRLPETLTWLGNSAFYRCYSLTVITVPASVTHFGTQVFAYCENLVNAIIHAEVARLPEWTFYGCTALGGVTLSPKIQTVGEFAFYDCESIFTIYCGEDKKTITNVTNAATQGNPEFNPLNVKGNDSADTAPGVSAKVETNEDSTTTVVTESSQTNNATVTTQQTIVNKNDGATTNVTVTVNGVVENPDGWQEVLEKAEGLDGVLENYKGDGSTSNVVIQVVAKNEAEAPQAVLEKLEQIADQVVILTNNNTQWVLSGTTSAGTENSFHFGTVITQLEEIPEMLRDILENSRCYSLSFFGSSGYRTQISLQLPQKEAGQVATLYAVNSKGKFAALQSAYVSSSGKVTYYMDGVDTAYTYYIGINPKGVEAGSILLPAENAAGGNQADQLQSIRPYEQYVITGVKSSWGITGWQMTLFIVGGFVLVLGTVGGIMYMYSKQRLKMHTVELDMSIDEEEAARLERRKKRRKEE